MGDNIYTQYRESFTVSECPTTIPWCGKFMRGLKFCMLVIQKQDFGVTSKIVKLLLVFLESDCNQEEGNTIHRREVVQLDALSVILFGVSLRGAYIFLTSLEGMIRFWEETRLSIDQYHVMVTLKVRFKVENG